MKGRKQTAAVLLAVLLALCLTACGGSSGGSDSNGSASKNDMSPAGEPMAPEEAGWAEMGVDSAAAVSSALADAKIIYTADMELETREYDQAVAALDRLVEETGSYYESRSSYSYGTYRSADMTVRVPAERYLDFCGRTGELAHRTRMSEDTQNVGEAYYDVEARLATQRTKLERLQELLAKAESMEDIIALESALSETELQIEYLTGSLRRYDSLVGYSTVNLQLREVYRLSTDEETPMTFGERLGSAFSTGLQRGRDNMEELVIGLAANWMTLLLLAAVIAGGVLGLRRLGRRRRKAVPPPQPAGEEKKDE